MVFNSMSLFEGWPIQRGHPTLWFSEVPCCADCTLQVQVNNAIRRVACKLHSVTRPKAAVGTLCWVDHASGGTYCQWVTLHMLLHALAP